MNHLIILAAGQGQRMGEKQDKLLLPVNGKPLIYFTIMSFNDHPEINSVTIVASKANEAAIKQVIKDFHFKKVKKITLGGLTRQNSLEKGFATLAKLAKKDDIILVHNGDNPLPSHEEISQCIEESEKVGACIVGHKIQSTIKEIKGKKVVKTHDRKALFEAQTPQCAKFYILRKALENANRNKLEVTDEAMLLEAIKQPIVTIDAHADNFKITTQGDYEKLKMILGDIPKNFRSGIGQDSHLFDEKKKGLTLAGLMLPNEKKLKANSDGDVILHAIFNAISQAIGENSLGFYADEMCEKGEKDSKKYLEPLLKKLEKQKLKLNTLGLMIECKTPKIDPLTSKLKKSLSQILNLPSARIGITATSGENATIFGQGLGIQCFAIVSLLSN